MCYQQMNCKKFPMKLKKGSKMKCLKFPLKTIKNKLEQQETFDICKSSSRFVITS